MNVMNKRKTPLGVILGVLALGWLAGTVQGYMQCEHNWRQNVTERATAYDQEGPVPIYEDTEGNVYYSHRESRGYAMVPPRAH